MRHAEDGEFMRDTHVGLLQLAKPRFTDPPEALCICCVPGLALITDDDGGPSTASCHIGQV